MQVLLKNPDSRPGSVPALQLHSRAASSVGVTLPFQQSQHRKQFRRKADNKKSASQIRFQTNFGKHGQPIFKKNEICPLFEDVYMSLKGPKVGYGMLDLVEDLS